MSKVEHPVVEQTPDDVMTDSRTTHPAFAAIWANRVSSSPGASLYGSDFVHQHHVTITIARSELRRSLANDWYSTGDEMIEVSLSEAQWATFVSSMNAQSTPCTLEHVNRKRVPGIPAPPDRAAQFAGEMHDRVKRIDADLKKISADKRLPVWAQKELAGLAQQLTNSTGFIADQFAEHVENTVEAARIEINAHITQSVQRAGLKALGAPVLELPGPKAK